MVGELVERRAFGRQEDAVKEAQALLVDGYIVGVRKDKTAVPSRRWVLEAWTPDSESPVWYQEQGWGEAVADGVVVDEP